MFLLPILLTPDFSLHVAPGQTVTRGTVLASSLRTPTSVVNIAELLGVSSKKVAQYLKKQPGDKVVRGEVLAAKAGTMGFGGERIICEIDGVVVTVSVETGEVIIRPEHAQARPTKTLISPVEGMITVCDNEKIVIQTTSPVIMAEAGHGQSGQGELVVLHNDHTQEIQYFHLDANARGRIILGGKFGRESLTKALGLRVAGILATAISPEDLHYVQQRTTVPILLIKGEYYSHFLTTAGKVVYIDGMSKSIVL